MATLTCSRKLRCSDRPGPSGLMRSMCPRVLQVMRLQLGPGHSLWSPCREVEGGPYVPLGVVGCG